jgi:CheY-like chemotaxis protein
LRRSLLQTSGSRRSLADAGRVRQVLLNLVCNAVKFTDSGAVSIAAQPDPAAGLDMLRFEVTDTGIGIPLVSQAELFHEFHQLHEDRQCGCRGSGLGLAISRRLVEAMGGSIGASSREGRGSVFWFRVPLAATAPAPGPAAKRRAHGAPARILLAEDLPMNQMILTEMLERDGHSVTVAGDGIAASAALRAGAFDVVLMDIEMPGMGGVEATRAIRLMGLAGTPPIVALTANAMPQQISAYLESGMDDFLSKPIDREALLLMVDKWMGGPEPPAAQTGEAVPAPDTSELDGLNARFGHERGVASWPWCAISWRRCWNASRNAATAAEASRWRTISFRWPATSACSA